MDRRTAIKTIATTSIVVTAGCSSLNSCDPSLEGNVVGYTCDAGDGRSVTMNTDYAFGTDRNGNKLNAWDITDKSNPTKVDSISLLSPNHSWLESSDDLLFVTERSGSLAVIDVSDPGRLEVRNTQSVNGWDYTYGVHANAENVTIVDRDENAIALFDVSNPDDITLLDTLSDSIMDTATQVRIVDGYAYVGASDDSRLVVVDLSDPNALSIETSIQDSAFDLIDGIEHRGDYLYTTTGEYHSISDTDWNMSVVDISDPADPALEATVVDDRLERSFTVRLSGDYAYCSGFNNGNVVVIDIEDPTDPKQVDYITHESEMHWVDVTDDYGVTIHTNGALQIFKID